jgi:hypothetical protein
MVDAALNHEIDEWILFPTGTFSAIPRRRQFQRYEVTATEKV